LFDSEGRHIVARRNRDGDLLAQYCCVCCPTQHGTRPIRLDTNERIIILDAQIKSLSGLISKALYPASVEEQCKRMEARARVLIKRAKRKRKQLQVVIRDRELLLAELKRKEYEVDLLRVLAMQKKSAFIGKRKGEIDKILSEFMQRQIERREAARDKDELNGILDELKQKHNRTSGMDDEAVG